VIEIGDIYADLNPTIDATNNLLQQTIIKQQMCIVESTDLSPLPNSIIHSDS
jgi:hypothetical protein